MVTKMASEGLRVLGICAAQCKDGEYPEDQSDFAWEFKGLCAMYDPPKKGVKTEFDLWYQASIKIKLVTGDFKKTAANIAEQVGIKVTWNILTGEEIMKMNTEEFQKSADKSSIFSRMFPEAKLKLIEALKSNGEIVAMMGDGVNDGPALRSAHIEIAMGAKGTEIARQAAALILTDDDLGKVTEAIRQGRKIYHNLKKAVRYIVSIHVPIILTASVPLLLNWKFSNIFAPIHIIFLELIMGPTCSILFENEPVELGMMQRPPRPRTNEIFTGKELLTSLLQGLVIAAGILGLYYYFIEKGEGLSYVRTLVFITLIVSNVFLTFVNRSFEENIFKTIRYKNSMTKYVFLASLIFIGSVAFIPLVRGLFELNLLKTVDYVICVGVGMLVTLWFEVYKTLSRKR